MVTDIHYHHAGARPHKKAQLGIASQVTDTKSTS